MSSLGTTADLPKALAWLALIGLGSCWTGNALSRIVTGVVRFASVATETPEEGLIYPDLLIKLEVNTSVMIPRFLAYALRTANSRSQIKDGAAGTSQSMVNISGERPKDVLVPVPHLEAQESLIEDLDTLHDLSRNLVEMREPPLNEMRQSILRKAFAGEL